MKKDILKAFSVILSNTWNQENHQLGSVSMTIVNLESMTC